MNRKISFLLLITMSCNAFYALKASSSDALPDRVNQRFDEIADPNKTDKGIAHVIKKVQKNNESRVLADLIEAERMGDGRGIAEVMREKKMNPQSGDSESINSEIPSRIQDAFNIACQSGDVSKVRQMIQENYQNRKKIFYGKSLAGLSPLHLAAEYGHEKVVAELLKSGANPNIQTEDDQTPLHLAVENNHSNTVKALIAHKARVNARDIKHLTPLYYALDTQYQNLELIKLLLSKGAKITLNIKSNKNMFDYLKIHTPEYIKGKSPKKIARKK